MEDNSDFDSVPSLSAVVENIYSSCDIEGNEEVPVSVLVDFMSPFIKDTTGLAELLQILDPKQENPNIGRNSFYEAMRKWTTKMKESDTKLSNFSFKESDSADRDSVFDVPFHQSTPKPSLTPTSRQNISSSLDFSNLSPTSFSTRSGSTMATDKQFLEEKCKELEHKYVNAISELSMVKSQLAVTEEQYAELKIDLDRTNKRLMIEQQVNADLQKSMEHNDDFKEEVVSTRKEMDHVQRLLSLTKKENSNLVSAIRDLEFEKEQFERKLSEMRRKEEQKKKDLADVQSALSLIDEENQLLKKLKSELEEKVDQQNSLLKHFSEVTEMLKSDIHTLQTVIKKSGNSYHYSPTLLKNLSNMSTPGTPKNSSETLDQILNPIKNMYIPSHFVREKFNFMSPKLLCQIISPISPNGLDTPKHMKHRSKDYENQSLSEDYETPRGVVHIPKGLQVDKSLEFDCSDTLTPTIPLVKPNVKTERNSVLETDILPPNESSAIAFSESFDDLDLSTCSEKQNGQDLMTELQDCKFLESCNKCYKEEHADWFKTVKEHENCSKIIGDYEEKIDLLSKDIKTMEADHNRLLEKYDNIEKELKLLEDHLRTTKSENIILVQDNCKLSKEITNLNNTLHAKDKELFEMYNYKIKNEQLLQQIEQIKTEKESVVSERNALLVKYETLCGEREVLTKQLEVMKTEKNCLSNENNNLTSEIEYLNRRINQLDEERCFETEYLRNENKLLEDENFNMKNEQEKNCREVDKLTRRLEQCNEMSKNFVDRIKKKLLDQNIKVEYLKDSNKKLEEYVDELRTEVEITKTNLSILKSSISEDKSTSQEKTEDDGSTSAEGSEAVPSFERPEHKKKSHYVRRSNYEKQQFKINKLEEEIEELQRELFNEKTKNQKFFAQISNLELQNIGLMEEKNSVLRELEATKYDLSLKDQMMQQFEEKRKFELENMKESFEKDKELNNLAMSEANKKAKDTETVFNEEIHILEKALEDCQREKKLLEKLTEKQGTKIIALKKALSDLTTSSAEGKIFETLVVEKESMLKFNRELLAKSNNSLQCAENRIFSLELLLDKCKMVLLETADDVFKSTRLAFGVWKNTLKSIGANSKLIDELESLESITDKTVCELTEQEIWTIHNQLSLSSQLLTALAKKTGVDFLGEKELTTTKSVSKFTMRPSKLQFRRLPSSDPDVSSSCIKECESPENTDEQVKMNVQETMTDDTGQELITNEVVGPKIYLKENDSKTDWLGHQIDNLSVQINDASNGGLSSPDVLTETECSLKTYQSIAVGNSFVAELKEDEAWFISSVRSLFKKCSTFVTMVISVVCLLALLFICLHLECVRSGNGTNICPLDFIVSIRRDPSGTPPY